MLPLARPMGRFAVPSALAIGSIVPDLWYFIPFVERAHSHDLAGLFWFCVPIGLLTYLVFHVVLVLVRCCVATGGCANTLAMG